MAILQDADLCALCRDDRGTESPENRLFHFACTHAYHEACVFDYFEHTYKTPCVDGVSMERLPCPVCKESAASLAPSEAALRIGQGPLGSRLVRRRFVLPGSQGGVRTIGRHIYEPIPRDAEQGNAHDLDASDAESIPSQE